MILEKLFQENKQAIEVTRILVLMLLVAVAVYQITSQDICTDINNTRLDKKDQFGFFYECRYLNQTELDILEKSKFTPLNYNLTPNFIKD